MAHGIHKRAEEIRAYWLMVLPAFLLYLLVLGFPIVISILLSLSNYPGGRMFGGDPWKIVGFQQYQGLIKDPQFWLALKNNVYIVLISVFGQLPLGFIFAYLIYRRIVRFGEFWQGVLYMPNIISVIVLGIMWRLVFSPNGLIAFVMNAVYAASMSAKLGAILGPLGNVQVTDQLVQRLMDVASPGSLGIFQNPGADLKAMILTYLPDRLDILQGDLVNLLGRRWTPEFLAKPDVAMLPIMFVVLWCWTGLYLILFLANMQKIDPQMLEAARIDGAGEGRVMSKIVLPLLSGVLVNSAILCISGSLNSFALIFAMTGGGPARATELLSIYMYRSAFIGTPNYPLANAISMSIVVLSLILIALTKIVERRFGGRE